MFAARFTGQDGTRNTIVQATLVILLIFFPVALTAPFHDLYWASDTMMKTPFTHIDVTPTVLHDVSVLIILAGNGMVCYFFVELYLKSRHRPSSAMLVMAGGLVFSLIPFALSWSVGFLVETYDHTSFGVIVPTAVGWDRTVAFKIVKTQAAYAPHMQRRAAAIYFVFFLVIGAAAYGYIGVVKPQKPGVSLDDPRRAMNDSFQISGQTYTITEIKQETESSGGHGGGGGSAKTVGTIEWTNQSARETATLENASNVTYQNRSWQVHIANQSSRSEFTLRENINVSQVLANDSTVSTETATFNGTTYVVYAANNTLWQPLSEYLPTPQEQTFSEGDTFPYEGNQATITTVEQSAVTLSWSTEKTNSVDLSEGGNVTLGGQTYLVHFPNNETVQLTQQFDRYEANQNRIDYFQERVNGLWGIVILSFFTAIVLLATAYLPEK